VQANLSCAQRFARFLFATDRGKSPRKILEPFTPTLERLKGGGLYTNAQSLPAQLKRVCHSR